MPLDYDDERIDEAWEKYQEAALIRYPQKALSKREFIAGYKLGFATGEQENAAHRDDMSTALNTTIATSGRLAAKLEAINKLCSEEKYKLSGDRDSYSQYWEGYEYCQDLVQQIIESPEDQG
jgi:hypothetical protein